MPIPASIIPFSLKHAPALIEKILPVQKLSAEAYKEQMAGSGKTLTALGSYWKGRKPLILAKACILGCLLPATDDLARDLEIFEMLMGMDITSLERRLEARNDKESRFILGQHRSVGHHAPYRAWVQSASRAEECGEELFDHIWAAVNAHLGTCAYSMPELMEQLGLMRFGHRPRMADTFCGSGQIPFEAARLGCDVYASDLSPVACMLTWGAFNIVGGTTESREKLAQDQQALVHKVQEEIDRLGVETDGKGWRAKVFLYCVEARCPQSGWMVPLLPTLIVSTSRKAVAELVPDPVNKRYIIQIRSGVSEAEMQASETGTVGREGKYGEAYLIHQVDGVNYKTKISTLRGDYQKPDGTIGNRLRLWEKHDFVPRPDDVFQERLYCVQWMRPKKKGKGDDYEFRAATDNDLNRERAVAEYIAEHLADWQSRGWLPDMRIEVGGPPRYQGLDLVRARGWTHWHHVFNPRQLLSGGLARSVTSAYTALGLAALLNCDSKLSRWHPAREYVAETFDNQALNTLFNYACQSFTYGARFFSDRFSVYPVIGRTELYSQVATEKYQDSDIYVTDPPYGDAVKYEEILDFFIAWLRKNPPPEYADWVWDSRRALAIKGEDEEFRQNMVAAYRNMAEHMPDNGLQVIMFTHQSGSIWGDMANIVWAAGLQVTAAWYVVTETESALREGSHVKGTVLLVLRKRQGSLKATRDDLAWEIQEEVEEQVKTLTGLSQKAKGWYRDDNLFEDADLQMAGYAAALRVLTKYAVINGKDMAAEAVRPRIKGQTTLVDELIEFAVGVANQSLVPLGIERANWDRLQPAERFYLKLIELEARGQKTLDNYQNFAKAFKVENFKPLMASERANAARLKSAVELGRTEMNESSELYNSVLRGALYALMELVKNKEGDEVLAHLALNVPTYYDQTRRGVIVELAAYLAGKLESLRPEEASAARVLAELVRNQRL